MIKILEPEKSLENKYQQNIIVSLGLEWKKKQRISYISFTKNRTYIKKKYGGKIWRHFEKYLMVY